MILWFKWILAKINVYSKEANICDIDSMTGLCKMQLSWTDTGISALNGAGRHGWCVKFLSNLLVLETEEADPHPHFWLFGWVGWSTVASSFNAVDLKAGKICQ